MGKYELAVFDIVQTNRDGECLVLEKAILSLEEALLKAVECINIVRNCGMRIYVFADFDDEHYELVCTMA